MKGVAVDVAVGAAVRLRVDPTVAQPLPWHYPDPFTPQKIPFILESTFHELPKKSEDTLLID